jgi:hypothetical protein
MQACKLGGGGGGELWQNWLMGHELARGKISLLQRELGGDAV